MKTSVYFCIIYCYVQMSEATSRVLWCLLKYQSIITENIYAKIGYPLCSQIPFSQSRSSNFFCFSGLGTFFHVCP